MDLEKIALYFINEVLIIAVFLSSVWIHLGMYPEDGIWKSIFFPLYDLLQNSYLFWLIPFFIIFVAVLSVYFIGGWLGLTAIALAFIGGYFLDNPFGVILSLIGLILGFFAPSRD